MTLKLTKTAQLSKFLYRNRVTGDRRMPIPFLGQTSTVLPFRASKWLVTFALEVQGMKQLAGLCVFSLLVCPLPVVAQEPQPAAQPSAEELEKQKEESQKNAYR